MLLNIYYGVIMAMIYSYSALSGNLVGAAQPVIYCVKTEALNDNAVSISRPLAEKLVKVSPRMRTLRMEQIFTEIIAGLPENPLVKDIDILFNPGYRIDVLLMLKSACKKKPFRILWPGTCEDGFLIYAEEGCQDYKKYNLNNYDITCIV